MKIQKTILVIAVVLLIGLVLILGGSPVGPGAAAFSQAQAPTSQPESTTPKIPQKLLPDVSSGQQQAPQQQAPQTPEDAAIQAAFQQAVGQKRQSVLGFLVFDPVVDSIHYSADGSTAVIWVALRDPQTGEVVATEPGLSIARNPAQANPALASSWAITFQTESNFTDLVKSLPDDLLTQDIRTAFLQPKEESALAYSTFTGYKLPWTAGVAKRVTNSIGHYLTVSGGLASCPSTCQYAFDFADGTKFPLLASKGGVVQTAKWICPNGGQDCTNYLILRDESTIPTTYQVYYHMAYNTLPDRLRTVGASVEQGEFIGNADDTGYSTGDHLHFHVYVNKSGDYSWGYSVDIAFADVSDNGGRPRTCAEASQYPNLGSQCQASNLYTSGNTPRHPPSATLNGPADRTVVTNRTVNLSGTTNDDIGISRIQVLANYDGSWKAIDDVTPTMGNWAKDVDLCSANIPDGPFGLTVRVYDVEGSQAPGLPVRQVIKNYSCKNGATVPPPPACMPNDNEVALYADRDYQGACQKFALNDAIGTTYTAGQLGAVGDNNAASVQVGKNVRAVLYDRSEDVVSAVVNGRTESLETSDASLADNRIGIDKVSGVYVQSRSASPDEPFFHAPFGNAGTAGTSPSSADSLVLSWEGGVGATAFEVNLNGPGKTLSARVPGDTASIGSLTPGTYSLSVKAVNGAGGNTTSTSFTVSPGSLPNNTVHSVPYQQDFETNNGDWAATGLWRYNSIDVGGWGMTSAWIYNNGANYPSGTWRAGDLTSPPITIPASGAYYLRFSYYMDVEDGNTYWDQRWVQVSVDGGQFINLKQLSDDKQANQSWLNSGAIPLDGVNGKTIRIRFHFNTVDEDYNGTLGWVVDDVMINTNAPDYSCADNGAVQDLAMNAQIHGVICPEGDMDIYRINAVAGQPFKVDIDAQSLNPPSALDSIIYLLDSDGTSVLAENDDEIYGDVRDSLLSYMPTRTGTYYVKVKPWEYPGAGSAGHFYTISLKAVPAGQVPRSVNILYPASQNVVPTMPFEISAAAEDYDGNSVAQVDFYWHGNNWSQPNWTKVGTDTNPADGWTVIIDPLKYGGITGGALYVQATGQTGGIKGAAMWDLHADDYAPVSSMSALPSTTHSTSFKINWDASDVGGDIDHYNLQYQVDGGYWVDFPSSFPANVHSTWALGQPGMRLAFRVRSVDKMGNVENFPANAQTATTIEASCTPDPREVVNQSGYNATPLQLGKVSDVYNFCKLSSPGAGKDDEDWFSFTAEAGETVILKGINGGGGTELFLSLFDGSGPYINGWESSDVNLSVEGKFTAPYTGIYLLKVTPVFNTTFGTDAKYQVMVTIDHHIFLPTLRK